MKILVFKAKNVCFDGEEIMGDEATNKQLITIFCVARMSNLAKRLRNLLLNLPNNPEEFNQDELTMFQEYLKNLYTASENPSSTQWPLFTFKSYIDLSLQEFTIPTSMHMGSKDQPASESFVLDKLFSVGKQVERKVLLIEGVAGCGKTALSRHSCRKWAKGEQHFQLFIYLSLNDPDIASAKCLADIIPHPDGDMRSKVAKAIQKINGKNICFFFDACDEAPETLWTGVLSNFISGRSQSSLQLCNVIMAARPDIHHDSNVYPIISGYVSIQGFTKSKLEDFFDANLQYNLELKKRVIETCKINPTLESVCSLPINAVILVHLFTSFFKDIMPYTSTSLFEPLVRCLLIRYMESTTRQCPEITCFSDLPPEILLRFKAVCKLAFSACMKRVWIFDDKLVKSCKVSTPKDAMGFLQLYQQLTAFGYRRNYSFLHSSLQEFLAAVHITWMNEQNQADFIQQVLTMAPLSQILPFYAAVLDVLLNVTKKPLDTNCIIADLNKGQPDRRYSLLALLNCVYETQTQAYANRLIPQCQN